MNRYTVEFKLNTKKQSDVNYLNNYFNEVARLSNTVRRFAMEQLDLLRRNSEYRRLLGLYVSLDKGPEKSMVSKELSAIVKSYRLTKYDVQKYALTLRKNLKYVHSDVYQKICDSVWNGIKDVLYSKGKQIHFKKWDDFLSFEGKSDNTGIIYSEGKVYINCSPKRPKGGIVLDVKLPNNRESDHWYYETQCLMDRTKYCRITRKMFSTGWRYYVQLIQDGISPQRHAVGVGRIGIDIGTSTIATVSDTKCHLDTIGDTVKMQDKEIKSLKRKLDRSRRKMNPGNYNSDGTIRKGKKRWAYSNRYKKLRNRLRCIQRKRAATLRQWQSTYASRLLEEGNVVFIEKMSFKGLSKRAKKTERNEKGRFKRKKRFGKSISVRAPAQLLSIIKRKLEYIDGSYNEVNTKTFKASQYNHVTDTYRKKKLSR